MKKIITIITLFLMTFSSGNAITGESIDLSSEDLKFEKIFYIGGEGYIKNNNKIVKLEGIKIYSIGGVKYIKDNNGEITKIEENKVYKINNINYVKVDGEIMLLKDYLKKEKKLTFEEMFKKEINPNLELTYLSKYKINKIKSDTLEQVSQMMKEKDKNIDGTIKLLNKDKFNTKQLKKLRDYYFDKGEIEIAKKIYILENISKIDVDKVNKVISKKLNNQTINIVKENQIQKDVEEFSFDGLLNEIENIENNQSNEELLESTKNTKKEVIEDTNTNMTEDQDFNQLIGDIFKDL